jgi:hypothetical protein
MDMSQPQPPESTTEAPPAEAPAPPPASGDSASAGEISGPPPDPYLPEFSEHEWSEMAEQTHMPVGELRDIFAPARQVICEMGSPELEAILSGDDERFGSLGDDPTIIRALGAYGADMRTYIAGEQQLLSDLTALAKESGQAFTRPTVAPLAGPELDQAVDRLLSRYMPHAGVRESLKHAGVFAHPAVRKMLVTMAQAEHRARTSLDSLSQQQGSWQERRREARATAAVQAMAPNVKAMSELEYEQAYGQLFEQWRQANDAGRWVDAQMANAEMMKLAQARYGG